MPQRQEKGYFLEVTIYYFTIYYLLIYYWKIGSVKAFYS